MLLKMDGDSELRRRGSEALRRELLSQYSEPTRQPRKSWGHWAWQQGGGEIETEDSWFWDLAPGELPAVSVLIAEGVSKKTALRLLKFLMSKIQKQGDDVLVETAREVSTSPPTQIDDDGIPF